MGNCCVTLSLWEPNVEVIEWTCHAGSVRSPLLVSTSCGLHWFFPQGEHTSVLFVFVLQHVKLNCELCNTGWSPKPQDLYALPQQHQVTLGPWFGSLADSLKRLRYWWLLPKESTTYFQSKPQPLVSVIFLHTSRNTTVPRTAGIMDQAVSENMVGPVDLESNCNCVNVQVCTLIPLKTSKWHFNQILSHTHIHCFGLGMIVLSHSCFLEIHVKILN